MEIVSLYLGGTNPDFDFQNLPHYQPHENGSNKIHKSNRSIEKGVDEVVDPSLGAGDDRFGVHVNYETPPIIWKRKIK